MLASFPSIEALGLGKALVLKSLIGFRESGVKRVSLDVTADNGPAVELYRSVGFRLLRTMFKSIDETPVRSSFFPLLSSPYRAS